MAAGTIGRGLIFALRIATGGLFVYAGAVKIPGAPDFAIAITNYQIVTTDVAVLAAVYLPWLEVVAGAGLVFRRLYAGSLAVLTTAMLIFMGAIVWADARGLDVSCGCFGAAVAPESHAVILARDAGILCALFVLAVSEWRAPRLSSASDLVD